jgi:heme/copper-type cytochrome/quinol oxidase subunit 4
MIAKISGLFFCPNKTWRSVAELSVNQLKLYLLIPVVLGLIPAFAWYVGTTQSGWTVGESDSIRLTTDSALAIAVAFYITQILAIWVIGIFIHWMSETYGAESSPIKGMALAGLTATPILLAGAVGFYPNFAIDLLVAIAAVSYSVYLLYVGIPLAMKVPAERGFLYASAMVGVALVIVICVMGGTLILWSLGLEPVFTD